jgi:aspartyl protease family protein
MIRLTVSFAAFVVVALACGVKSSPADWLRWVDGDGVLHFTDKLENVPEAYRERTASLDIPPTPPRPAEPARPDSVSIPLESEGQVAVVLAVLNGRTPASLIVDTGATYTVISYDMADELRIDVSEHTPVTRLQTANGVITAPVVELDSVDVGGMKLNQIKAAVHDFASGMPAAGLLGLNFLKHFRVDIDTATRTLVLQRRSIEP